MGKINTKVDLIGEIESTLSTKKDQLKDMQGSIKELNSLKEELSQAQSRISKEKLKRFYTLSYHPKSIPASIVTKYDL
jgi:TolA-binding protein